MKNNRKGFTTVELVIVIAVIAILAAVLIPTFTGLVEKANNSAILQEARNAYSQYVIDHTGTEGFTDSGCVAVVKGAKTYYVAVKNGAMQEEDTYSESAIGKVLACTKHVYDKTANPVTGKCTNCDSNCSAEHVEDTPCDTCGYTKNDAQ